MTRDLNIGMQIIFVLLIVASISAAMQCRETDQDALARLMTEANQAPWHTQPAKRRVAAMQTELMGQLASKRWKTPQAAQVAELWGLSPEDVAQPVRLWGGKGGL